jgi:PAS domain S-box-containing protein
MSEPNLTTLSRYLSDASLHGLFAMSSDAIYILAADGRFLDANQAMIDRLGYSREELVAVGFPQATDPDDAAKIRAGFIAAINGTTSRHMVSGTRRDGSEYTAEVVNVPLQRKGKTVAVLGLTRDVSKLEGARKAHETLEALFESTLNSITDGLFFLDNQWRFTYVNPRGLEIAKKTREQMIGNVLWELFPPMIGTELGIGYRRAKTEQIPVVTRGDYDPFGTTVETTAYPTNNGLVVYVRDISEQERSRAALADKERQIAYQAALLDSARDAIIVRGLDDTIGYWNRAAADLYGWSSEEALGKSIRDLTYRSPEDFDAATLSTLANGQWAGDIEQVARDGTIIVSDCRWSLVVDADGNPEAIFDVNTDVTLRRRNEETHLRAERMESLGTLAGGIAHDLNNVLTPLLMSVQFLSAAESDPEKLATLAVIEGSAKRGADMMRQVLSFARGVEGRRIHVDTNRLIADTESFCREALSKSIRVHSWVAPGTWDTIGDPTQLLQVLVNLVGNARDAMSEGGDLRISARNVDVSMPFHFHLPSPGRYVRIEVEDSGTGMTAEIAKKAFEPFFTTKRIGEGTGLGLATSIATVRSHGGNMQVYSEPEIGSRFDIFLPAAAPEAAAATSTPAAVAPQVPRGTGQLVLVVDDEPNIRHVAKQALETWGYRTAVAGNGAEALEYLDTFPDATALVFSDMSMPVMDGTAMLAQIDELYPQLPVLLASGLNTTVPPSTSEAKRHFMAKPYIATELRLAVARMLGLEEDLQPEPELEG